MNQSTAGLNLLISDKPDRERNALADVFARRGGTVHRTGRSWSPPIQSADRAGLCFVLSRAPTEARGATG